MSQRACRAKTSGGRPSATYTRPALVCSLVARSISSSRLIGSIQRREHVKHPAAIVFGLVLRLPNRATTPWRDNMSDEHLSAPAEA
jgi:hypothetical protein